MTATALDQVKKGAIGFTDTDILKLVGERLRYARAKQHISRRLLSERSGISQRYLAQLEAGEGNISIALLHKVAIALEQRIEWFIHEDIDWTNDISALATLYKNANEEQRQRVINILDPTRGSNHRAQRIALIGLRGAGKSTLGRLVGQKLDVPFKELNDEIAQHNGMSVREIFALYGQEGYRLLERREIERVTKANQCLILAIAGGIVHDTKTFSYLLHNFHTIWLKATPEEHMERVRAQGDERPMAGNPSALSELRQILFDREALYTKANVMIDTSSMRVEQSLTELTTLIEANHFLHAPSA